MSLVASVIELDNPWHRLPWSLPLALAICTVVLWELGNILQRPPPPPIAPVSIEAQLVELPPPNVEEKIAQPRPERPKPAPQRPKVEKKVRRPAPRPANSAPPAPVALPVAPATPETQEKGPAPPPPAPARPSVSAPSNAQSAGAATMGAQAIVRPLPQIPDELRQDAFRAVAVARFHIALDGTATFELLKPTPNPRLNRLLLDKLKDWRFFPAMREGKPVASDQDIRITFEVK